MASVTLPEFDDLHGDDGMNVVRQLTLLLTNEQSSHTRSETCSAQNDRPTSHTPLSHHSTSLEDQKGLDTLVEEDEEENDHKLVVHRSTRPTSLMNPDFSSGSDSSRCRATQRKHQRSLSTTHVQPSRSPDPLSSLGPLGTGATVPTPALSSTRNFTLPLPLPTLSENLIELDMP